MPFLGNTLSLFPSTSYSSGLSGQISCLNMPLVGRSQPWQAMGRGDLLAYEGCSHRAHRWFCALVCSEIKKNPKEVGTEGKDQGNGMLLNCFPCCNCSDFRAKQKAVLSKPCHLNAPYS